MSHICHENLLLSLHEMLHYEAFHLGLHCLPKYLFACIQNENDLDQIDLKSKDIVCVDIMLSKQLIAMMLINLNKCVLTIPRNLT